MSEFTAILGVGSYLPKRVMTNQEMAERVDTSDAWIQERTGIRQRHIAADGELTSDLGLAAAQTAIQDAGISVDQIDLIICATSTPDYTFPSTATIIQNALGMHHGAAFDVQAVCSGFIYALSVAQGMIKAGTARTVLVIGCETFSRILDWEDRGTCVLFGDGAGALIVGPSDTATETTGIRQTYIRSDGRFKDLLHVDGGPSATQTTGKLRMIGNQVFKHAVKDIVEAMRTCAEMADTEIDDIDWFIPHQANQRILNGVANRLKIDPNQVVSTVADHANTSAASIPLALDAAIKDGRIKRGDTLMLEGFGGGFTWGAALLGY